MFNITTEKIESNELLTLGEIESLFRRFPENGPVTAFRGVCLKLCEYVGRFEEKARAADKHIKSEVDDLKARAKRMAADLERIVSVIEEVERESPAAASGAEEEEEEEIVAPPPGARPSVVTPTAPGQPPGPQAASVVTPAVPGQPPAGAGPPPADPKKKKDAASPNGK